MAWTMWKCGLSHCFRVGFSGGVNWLGEEELRNLFDSMDADGSGKLNLGAMPSMLCTNTKHEMFCLHPWSGELQCTAIRLTDLAERVQRFCEENEARMALFVAYLCFTSNLEKFHTSASCGQHDHWGRIVPGHVRRHLPS